MDELRKIIKAAASFLGLQKLRDIKPEDFELMVECALIDVPAHEACTMRRKMSRIADTLSQQSVRTAASNWANVAWNLNPDTGFNQRVGRSYNR
jgi:hypothetical protein|tara:strand:- start:1612 stop:1893 length:282 start_codon:yes stop_codon:yes gene_type:complete